MFYPQAKKAIAKGCDVEFVTKDATRSVFIRYKCRMYDEDLEFYHEQLDKWCSAPTDGQYDFKSEVTAAW